MRVSVDARKIHVESVLPSWKRDGGMTSLCDSLSHGASKSLRRVFGLFFMVGLALTAPLHAEESISSEDVNPATMQPRTLHPGAVRKGFYTGLSTGRLMYTSSERNLYTDGWVVGFKAGYDIWKYLGFEGLFKFSAHSSTLGSSLANTPPSFIVYLMIG